MKPVNQLSDTELVSEIALLADAAEAYARKLDETSIREEGLRSMRLAKCVAYSQAALALEAALQARLIAG